MAVPGRKSTDLLSPIYVGSEEEEICKCEPCLTVGLTIKAYGFCVTCQEYLCKTCHDCHRRTKFSRNHQILTQDEFDKLQTSVITYNECTEHCLRHEKEIIKFYCQTHHELGCNDCIIMGHRNCTIDYIPENCVEIADGIEYKNILEQLSETLKAAEEVSKKAEERISDINVIAKEAIKNIEDTRAEINERLDQMQKCILNTVEEKQYKNKETFRKVTCLSGNIISHVKKLQSSMHANKSNRQNGQLFIDIKRAVSTLKSDELDELKEAREHLLDMNIQYSFRRSADLDYILSKEIVFGELFNHSHTEKNIENTIDHLTMKTDINVKTLSDEKECCITGCAVLPTNKLVLVDFNNKKVKILSVQKKLVINEKPFSQSPRDVAAMPDNKFAVTIPEARKIDIMTTDDKLPCVRSIDTNGNCYDITFHQDCLYAICSNPSHAVVLTAQGDVLKNIPLEFLSPNYVPHIAIREDSNLLYISDTATNRVISVSLQGELSATYKQTELQEPMGMCVLGDGSLLVCCRNGTIRQVENNLKDGKVIYEKITFPKAVCFSEQNCEVYVGCYGNQIKILSTR